MTDTFLLFHGTYFLNHCQTWRMLLQILLLLLSVWWLAWPVWDKLCVLRVKCLPGFKKHLQVIITQPFSILWVEDLQDDSDIQVDDEQEGQKNVCDEEYNTQYWAAAFPDGPSSWVFRIRVAVWRCVHNGHQQIGPFWWCAGHKQTDHAAPKSLKIKQVINHELLLHIGKVEHAKHGVDDHHEEQDDTNVEKGRNGLHKGQNQLPDSPGPGNKMEYTTNTEQSEQWDYKCWYKIFL